jgi:hypothetical protein
MTMKLLKIEQKLEGWQAPTEAPIIAAKGPRRSIKWPAFVSCWPEALRRGLSVAIASDPSFSEDIKRLASALAHGRSGPNIGEFALQAAGAEIDLLRIRKLRASRYNAILGDPETRLDDHSAFNEELAKLERYERRAFSRRKRALRALTLTES